MRWFLVFLIVANVILYFWVQQQSRPLPGFSSLPSPDIGRLRLLSEVDDGPAHGGSEEPEPPLVDAEEETMVEPPVAELSVAPSPAAAEPLVEVFETTERPGTESSAYVEPFMGGAEAPDDQSRITPVIPEAAEPTVTEATETASLNRPAEEIEEKAAQDVSEKVGRLVEQAPVAETSVEATAALPSQADPEDVVQVPDVASPAVGIDPGDAGPLTDVAPAAVVQAKPKDDEPTIDAAEPVVGTEQALCARAGPFEPDEADKFISGLPASVMLLSDVSEDYAIVDRYYVLIPTLPSRAAGRQKLKELADAGFTDTWLFPSGEYRNAISLGFFSRERGAKRHAANIAEKGFTTEVRGRTSTRKRRWLLLRGSGASDLDSSLTLPTGVGLERLDCP